MYIRLFPSSVRMEQLGWHWTDYYEIWYLNIFLKPVEKIQESLKHGKKGHFTWRPIHIFGSYLPQFFLEWKMFQTKVVEKIKTHILCSINFFFWKSCPLRDNVEIYCCVVVTKLLCCCTEIVVLLYVLFVLYCSMYCLCVNVYCHRVTTQLQLTNISYHIISYCRPEQVTYINMAHSHNGYLRLQTHTQNI